MRGSLRIGLLAAGLLALAAAVPVAMAGDAELLQQAKELFKPIPQSRRTFPTIP